MKTTALEKMEIPNEVSTNTSFSRSSVNHTEYSCDMPTGVMAKFVSSIWLTGGSSVALSVTPFVAETLPAIPIILGIASGLLAGYVTLGSLLMDDNSLSDMEDEFRDVKKDIMPSEWKENDGRRFRLHSKSRRSAIVNMLLPRRIFKPVLMNETIWYSPQQDLYTIEKHYLTAFNWVTETAEIDGRRRVFTKALNSF